MPEATPAPAEPLPPTIHEADLASGTSGIVQYGAEIDFEVAVTRRKATRDVVVRGDNLKCNRALAEKIEAAVGPHKRHTPHERRSGPHALPHFQQVDREHGGHCFYETTKRRARKQP